MTSSWARWRLSNHQPHDCLLNRLFGRRSKKTSTLRVTGLCAASNVEKVSIWWRHHGKKYSMFDSTWLSSTHTYAMFRVYTETSIGSTWKEDSGSVQFGWDDKRLLTNSFVGRIEHFMCNTWIVWKQVSRAGASNYIQQYPWGVITCPCPWYLLLPHTFLLCVGKSSQHRHRHPCMWGYIAPQCSTTLMVLLVGFI